MWLKGSQLSWTSSGKVGSAARTCSTLLSRLPCVSITPFGLPVVPEVYMIVARSSRLRAVSQRASSAKLLASARLPFCKNCSQLLTGRDKEENQSMASSDFAPSGALATPRRPC